MSSKIEKIKKLLALSKSPNEHEAALALATAMRMASEEGVDLSDLDLDDNEIIDQAYSIEPQSKTPKPWQSYLWIRVARLFGCHIYLNTYINKDYNQRHRIKIVGTKSDIEIADYVGCYLQREIQSLCRREIKSVRKGRRISSTKIRDDFLFGAAVRVIRLAEDLYKQEQQGGGTAYAMVLSKAGRAKAWIDNLKSLKPVKYTERVDDKAFDAGYARSAGISLSKGVSGSGNARKQIGG